MIAITLLAFAGIFYAYFGYPLLLYLLPPRKRPGSAGVPLPPSSYSIIIAVRNEAPVIAQKIANTMALVDVAKQLGCEVEVIVASDASDDGTDDQVRNSGAGSVRLVRTAARGGKERAQSEALQVASGEIILFTDAKVKLDADAIPRLRSYFSDPTVGAVSTIDRIEGAATEGSGEGFYVRYEMWLRTLETRFDSLVGLSGSGFAVRKKLCSDWRTDVPSDFVAMLRTKEQGLRGVLAPDIVCTYRAVGSEQEEFGRKVRTVLRGITALLSCSSMMSVPRYGSFAWQVISHKLFRWLVPWFFALGMFGSLLIAARSEFFALLFLACFATLLLAVFAWKNGSLRSRVIFKIPLFFVVSNLAVAVAWIRYLRGERTTVWNPSAKTPAQSA